jgi:hypothetical protein
MSYNTFTPIVTDGLVLYLDAANTKSYPGTGTSWLDLSKNGNTGTLVSNPTFNPSDGSGGIVFNGSNQYCQVANATSLNSTSGSINVWFKMISVTSGTIAAAAIIGKSDITSSFNGYNILIGDGGGMFIQIKNSSQTTQSNLPITLSKNIWYLVTLTYVSGVSHALYINGTLYNSGSCVSFTMSTQPLRLVDTIDSVWGIMAGTIGQVSVYNKSLSASEVLQNYNATKFRYL